MRDILKPALRIAILLALTAMLSPFFEIQAFADILNEPLENTASAFIEEASGNSIAAVSVGDTSWATCGTCEWMVDKTGKLIIRPINGIEGTLEDFYLHPVPWMGKDFISVSFEGKVVAPSARRMFDECSSLESADLSGLDTSSAKDMSNMFWRCSSLSSVNLSALDTSSVTDMSNMFEDCRSLSSVDFLSLDTSSVAVMSNMFKDCSALKSIDLTKFKSDSITNASGMFAGCSSLKTIKAPEGFPLAQALPPSCYWLNSGDGVIYESAEVPSGPAATYTKIKAGATGYVFLCGTCEWFVDDGGALVVRPIEGLASGELRDWSAEPNAKSPWAALPIVSAKFEGRVVARTATGMFKNCPSLKSIDLSGLDTSSVKDMSDMFDGCSSLESIDLSGFESTCAINASYMFCDCSSLKSLDLSFLDFSNLVDMDVMFSGCSSLESLELPRLDSQSLRGLTSTFRGCSSLKTLDLRKVDAPRLYDLNWTFADCSSLQSIDLASSRFSRMESMHRTFYNCSSLQSVDLSNFCTSKVTDMEYMFEGCGSLRSLDLSGLDTSNVSSMRKIFAGCDSLQSLVLPSHGPGLYTKSMFYFSCGESFRMTIGPDFDSYDATTNSYASFPSIRTGQHLDRIVTGKWVNVNTGEVLASSSIPSCQAATYTPQVIYRSAAPSVKVSGDPCPAESLTATVRIDGDAPPSDMELTYQWYEAESAQPVSDASRNPHFKVPEGGGRYYCIVTDPLDENGKTIQTDVIAAIHPLVDQWAFDESHHWRECSSCGAEVEKSEHTYGKWETVKRPLAGNPGMKERRCTSCGYLEQKVIPANPFSDVYESSTPHYDHIQWIAERKIANGFPDGTFRPYAIVARADMAAFLYRLAGEPAFDETSAPRFSDVSSSTPHRRAILWLASRGISKGWDNGDGTFSFRPYANVARADMAAFLYRLAGSPKYDETAVTSFRDVPMSAPHRKAILWLASSGVSKGWDEGDGIYSFRPYLGVARADMAAFLHRMDEYGLAKRA